MLCNRRYNWNSIVVVFFMARQGEISWSVHLFVRDRWPTEFWLCKVEVKTRSFQHKHCAHAGRPPVHRLEWKHRMMLHIFIVCDGECCVRWNLRACPRSTCRGWIPRCYCHCLCSKSPNKVTVMKTSKIGQPGSSVNALICALWRVALTSHLISAFQNLNKTTWKPWFELITSY